MFPRAGSAQFISEDLVYEARQRAPEGYQRQPIVLGVDVARYGGDQSVILVCPGTAVLEVRRCRELDTMQSAARVAEAIDEHRPTATFIDGVGVGAGVVDRLKSLGYDIIDVNGGGRPTPRDDIYNLRAEMWSKMRDWLRDPPLPTQWTMCRVPGRVRVSNHRAESPRPASSPSLASLGTAARAGSPRRQYLPVK